MIVSWLSVQPVRQACVIKKEKKREKKKKKQKKEKRKRAATSPLPVEKVGKYYR
jgi:hypothetical protein